MREKLLIMKLLTLVYIMSLVEPGMAKSSFSWRPWQFSSDEGSLMLRQEAEQARSTLYLSSSGPSPFEGLLQHQKVRADLATASSSSGSSHEGVESKPKILKEMMSGVLHGRRVTLILEEEEEEALASSLHQDELIKSTDSPLYLLRLPQVIPENSNSTEAADQITHGIREPVSFPLTQSVVVIILGFNNHTWWPLLDPPSHWNMMATVLITSWTCSAEPYLRTHLLEMSPSLALLCPYRAQGQKPKNPFRVWSWRPFAERSQLADLGEWNDASFVTWDQLFIDRFEDMTQKQVSILIHPEDRPLIYLFTDGKLRGLNYNIMGMLSKWLKFSLTYINRGHILWTTIFDSVKSGETDLFINYGTITPERNEEFDLTIPYYREGFGIMLEIPPPLPRWHSIHFPFTWPVWLGVVLSLSGTAILYHILIRKKRRSFVSNYLNVLQSLLSNQMDFVPEGWPVRIFLISWWWHCWFVNKSYTCNLIAVLTVPVFSEKLQTAEDLSKSHYRLCMLDYGEFVDEALAESTHPVLSSLSRILDMVPSNDYMEHIGEEQCIEKVLAGTHAHTETYSYVKILYSMLGHGSQVYSFKEQLYPGYLAFLVRKHSPWTYKFNSGIERMIEAGLTQKWYKDSMADFRGFFEETPTPELQPLSLGHLQGPFFLYVAGLLISTLILLSEVLFPPRKDLVPKTADLG